MANILIIDDDKFVCDAQSRLFRKLGHDVTCALTLAEGVKKARQGASDVVFLDVIFPEGSGLDVLPQIKQAPSAPEVIIITGAGNPDGAELALKSGAWDYVEKGSSRQATTLPLARALQYRERRQGHGPPVALKTKDIIGDSPAIRACFDGVAQAAASDANVLITGETGTGKELFARAIHANSVRADEPFVVVDCAALPDGLVPSVLFGHEKGAFTSADKTQEGLIKHADRGTLFLDEVGEMPLSVQKAFLRVLQERRFYRVGGTREVVSDFRLIAATNKDLPQLCGQGPFREDLLFRLRSLTIDLPPLRQRAGDVNAIAFHQIARVCKRLGIEPKGLSPGFLTALAKYPWPGNVRELLHTLDRAVSAAHDAPILFLNHLPTEIRLDQVRASLTRAPEPDLPAPTDPDVAPPNTLPTLREYRNAAEKRYLCELVALCKRDMNKAAQISAMSRPRLYALLHKHGLSPRP